MTLRGPLLPALLAALLAAAGPPLAAPAGTAPRTEILPYDQVRAGMKGSGRTVFHGELAESFDAEILGKVDRIGPGQNLILARLSSPTLAATGVLEGMSGSPVYVDGKMIGAIAYSWGFAREPIAGITPIEEMLSIPEPVPPATFGQGGARIPTLSRDPRAREELLLPLRGADRFDALLAKLFQRAGAASPFPPVGLTVSAAGLSGGWLDERLRGGGASSLRMGGGAGFTASAMQAVEGADAPPAKGGSLAPGDAVGAQLVHGDIEFTAFGTVTRTDGNRVLAFGHPFLQLGAVEYPMTRARIESLLPSLSSSFKIAAPAAEVGVFFQDRAAGLSGLLGARARMVPVRLELRREGAPTRSFAYEVVADPLLTPVLLYLTLGGILETTQKGAGDASIELGDGSALLLDKARKADLSNLFVGRDAVLEASATVGLIAEALLQNEYETVRVEGVNLIVRWWDQPKQARITGAWADRRQVRPGERVVLKVGLKPYREEESLETIPIEIPKELAPGRLTLHVGEALTVTRIEQSGANGYVPLDLDQLLDLINGLRRNQSLAILGTRDEPSLLIGSEPFPNLPPTKSSLILHGESRGNVPVLRVRPVLDETMDSDFEIEGYRRVELEVIR